MFIVILKFCLKIQINKEVCLPSENEIAGLKSRWLTYSNGIVTELEQYQILYPQFYHAIKSYLQNKEKYAQRITSLSSGMYTAFKYKGISSKTKTSGTATRCKEKRNSIQPTSVARKKMRGLHTFSERRSLGNNKKKAAHSLKTCIEKNIGLEVNKSRK